jgi:hypothetical protein
LPGPRRSRGRRLCLRTGELDGSPDREPASAHLRGCDRCQARLTQLNAVVAPHFDFGAEALRAHAGGGQRGWRWWLRALWLAPLAAAAVAMVVSPRQAVRSKGGGWQLGVYAQRPNGRVEAASPGAVMAPGDGLRFEVVAPEDGFVAVISLDARHTVTPFAPAAGKMAAVHRGRQLLDGAVRLGDALGPERLLLLACKHPFGVPQVVAAGRAALGAAGGRAEQVEELGLPCSHSSFWIRKEVRR